MMETMETIHHHWHLESSTEFGPSNFRCIPSPRTLEHSYAIQKQMRLKIQSISKLKYLKSGGESDPGLLRLIIPSSLPLRFPLLVCSIHQTGHTAHMIIIEFILYHV